MKSSNRLVWCIGLFLLISVCCISAQAMNTTMSFGLSNLQADFLSGRLLDFGRENPYKEFNTMINNIFFQVFRLEWLVPYTNEALGEEHGYYMQCYLRDLIMGTFVYWITAGIWSLFIYGLFRDRLFTSKGRPLPSYEIILDSMCLAQSSLLVYAGLPVISEYLIEKKLTHTYFYIDEIGGWGYSLAYWVLYLAFVEFGIYWMHRTLHTNKFLYKYVHGLHHKYNKPTTLTPWASIAFNPLDGMLQASPYVIGLFVVPVHYFTHIIMLFFSGVWATNIHDSTWSDFEPIMGSKYHTMHHTHYHVNFGQFFTFCDELFGTLRKPQRTKYD